jgi:hypothetical protein
MGLFDGVGKFFGNLFGDSEEEKRKRQQQAQAQQQAQVNRSAPQNAPGFVNSQTITQTTTRPVADLKLVLPGQPLQKPGNPITTDTTTVAALKKPGTSLFDNAANFGKGVIDKGGGGIARAAIRLSKEQATGVTSPLGPVAGLLMKYTKPGQQVASNINAGYDDFLASTENTKTVGKGSNLENPFAYSESSGGGQIGRKVGTAIKAGTDIAMLSKGTKEGEALGKNIVDIVPRFLKKPAAIVPTVAGSLGGSFVSNLQTKGMGDKTDAKKDVAIGLGADLLFPGLGKVVGRIGGLDEISQLTKNVDTDAAIKIISEKFPALAENDLINIARSTAVSKNRGEVSQILKDAENKASNVVSAPNAAEVAPGVKSANPNQLADAEAQNAAKAAEDAKIEAARAQAELDKTPAYQRQPVKAAEQAAKAVETDAKAVEMGAGPSGLDVPAFEHKRAIQDTIDQGDRELNDFVNGNQNATPQQIEAAKAAIESKALSRIKSLQDARYGADTPQIDPTPPPVIDAAIQPAKAIEPSINPVGLPEPGQVTQVANDVPLATAGDVAQAAPTPAPLVDNAVAADGVLPQIPDVPGAETVDMAPRTHDALIKQMGPSVDEKKGIFRQKPKINLDDLRTNADAVVANMDDAGLIQAFQTTGPNTMITDANSFAVARSALERLSKLSDDPIAAQTVTNIMDAMERQVSKSGEYLRIVQDEFDNMPLPMKLRYIVKKIDSANAETKGYSPLRDDPEKAALVEANVTAHLKNSQSISERIAAMEGQLISAKEQLLAGQTPDVNITQLADAVRADKLKLAESNGELAKYYADLLPGRSNAQKGLVDLPRQMMLASFTGRINDVATTGFNVANLGAQNVTQGILNKGVNLVSSALGKPGAVIDTLKGTKALAKDTAKGVKMGVGEFRGKQYAGDLQKALANNADPRSGLQKPKGKFGRTVQAATEFATNASEGVRGQRLYQLADQQAAKAGLTGQARREFAAATAATPTRQMIQAADDLKAEVNNLNDNPITKGLNSIANGIKGDTAVGGLIKNQVMPFTSWLGGNIWNSVTDKNVVANTAKLIHSAAKGDLDGITRNLAKGINNTALMLGVGYTLAKAGILVNEEPADPTTGKAYNDAGAYLKIGDRYVPVGFFGFAAPSLIMGGSTYKAMNGEGQEGKSTAQKIMDGSADALLNLGKSINLAGALGTENNLTRAYQTATKEGGNIWDGVTQFGAGVVGQYIPGLTGDVNAVLNNQTSLNPTKEAAQTKVVNPNSPSGEAKDVKKSAVASLKNRIPFLSQTLPRKAGVAAADLVDRTTKGTRGTPGSATFEADKKAVGNQSKDFEARGVPDPNKKYKDGESFDNAVKARFESGEYDKAIEGLKAKLSNDQGKKDIPKSKLKETEDKIKLYEVHKDGGYKPEFADKYGKVSLSEWRDLGDPESDTYNPELYQKLYDYDNSLAGKAISGNSDDPASNKYTAKKPGKGRGGGGGGSGGGSAASLIKGNTIDGPVNLGKVSLGDLAPQKAGSIKIPTIQQIRSSDLIKKRAISVKKG